VDADVEGLNISGNSYFATYFNIFFLFSVVDLI